MNCRKCNQFNFLTLKERQQKWSKWIVCYFCGEWN